MKNKNTALYVTGTILGIALVVYIVTTISAKKQTEVASNNNGGGGISPWEVSKVDIKI